MQHCQMVDTDDICEYVLEIMEKICLVKFKKFC